MSDAPPPPPPPGTPTIGQIATPHVLGYMMNWGLFGALVVQAYIYYLAFPKDKFGIKCLVYGLVLIETVQSGFMAHDAVQALGLGFGNPAALDNVHFAWLTIPLMSSVVSCVVQCFFAWRIYILSKMWYVSILIVLISLLQCSAGLAQAVFSIEIGQFHLIGPDTPITLGIWLVGAAVCDVLIAVFMSFILSQKQTGFKRTDAVITRLVRLTIETGSATAIMAVITAGLSIGLTQADYFVTPSYILAKLYTNNLLMIFNSRLHILNGRNGPPQQDASHASFSRATSTQQTATLTDESTYAGSYSMNSKMKGNDQYGSFIAMKGLLNNGESSPSAHHYA